MKGGVFKCERRGTFKTSRRCTSGGPTSSPDRNSPSATSSGSVPSSYRRAGPQRGIACEALARLPPPCCVRVLFLSARVPLASPPEPGCRLPNGIRHGTASRVDGGGSREPTLFLLPAFGVTDGALCAIWARFLASVAAVAALASVATVSCCPPPPLMIMMMPSLPSSLAHTAGCWLLAAGCWLRAAAA